MPLDDLFDGGKPGDGVAPQVLGQVQMEFSRAPLLARERELLLAGVLVTVAGLLFGGALALGLGRGVVMPIMRVSRQIESIGQGDFSPWGSGRGNNPLQGMQLALDTMAQRLREGRDELEGQVAAATVELREKKEEAETATRAKSQFLAAASHDLRQPTHALGMFVARLAQLPHDADTAHLVTQLDASVRAMQDLLDSLLDISKLDAGAVRAQPRSMPLGPLLQQVAQALASQAQDRGLRLRVHSSNAWVHSDPALLQRILTNLVANAVRYTPSGTVLLAARPAADGRSLRIEVRDSGIGIAPEHQQQVFREFFQVRNAERDRSKGLGLGLNIVERTAHLLGTEIGLRSGLGCGSCFHLRLPLATPQTLDLVPAAAEPQPQADLDGLQVLVVEDDLLARSALSTLLQSWGCVVRMATGLQEAQAALEAGAPVRVIVSDYRLGEGENGIDVIAALRLRHGAGLAACLMSGDTDEDLLHAARDAGLTLLHKPVRPAKLRSLIRHLGTL